MGRSWLASLIEVIGKADGYPTGSQLVSLLVVLPSGSLNDNNVTKTSGMVTSR